MPICNDIIKERTIRFDTPGDNPAEKAHELLSGIEGIEQAKVIAADELRIRYDVRHMTLHRIESALREVGFSLTESIITNFKRAVFAYCEDALRASLGSGDHGKADYQLEQLRKSATQDPRPDDWRHYVQE